MLGNTAKHTTKNFLVFLLQGSGSTADIVLVSDKLTITNLVIMLTLLFQLIHRKRKVAQLKLEVCWQCLPLKQT